MATVELPNFEEMQELINKIHTLSLKKAVLSLKISEREAEVVREVTSNPTYWKDGKQPSMSFIESTYKVTGIGNDIIELRKELSVVQADLDYAKLLLELKNKIIDVWRTQVASERVNLSI